MDQVIEQAKIYDELWVLIKFFKYASIYDLKHKFCINHLFFWQSGAGKMAIFALPYWGWKHPLGETWEWLWRIWQWRKVNEQKKKLSFLKLASHGSLLLLFSYSFLLKEFQESLLWFLNYFSICTIFHTSNSMSLLLKALFFLIVEVTQWISNHIYQVWLDIIYPGIRTYTFL